MDDYRFRELQRVLNGTNETEPCRLKVTGPQGMTNWLIITKSELETIQRTLKVNN